MGFRTPRSLWLRIQTGSIEEKRGPSHVESWGGKRPSREGVGGL